MGTSRSSEQDGTWGPRCPGGLPHLCPWGRGIGVTSEEAGVAGLTFVSGRFPRVHLHWVTSWLSEELSPDFSRVKCGEEVGSVRDTSCGPGLFKFYRFWSQKHALEISQCLNRGGISGCPFGRKRRTEPRPREDVARRLCRPWGRVDRAGADLLWRVLVGG